MKSILGVIDSGTTLVLLPEIIFVNFITQLAETVKDDPEIDLVCNRKNDSSGVLKRIDHCYFNNTDCSSLIDDHGSKLGSLKFHMGDYIFEQSFATALRDGNNTVGSTKKKVPCCSLGIRGRETDYINPKRQEYLIGNVFLKNFYSVYDYDRMEVQLGLSVHSKDLANIKKYKEKSWSSENGYKHLSWFEQNWKRDERDDWQSRVGSNWEIEIKIGNTNGDLP